MKEKNNIESITNVDINWVMKTYKKSFLNS